MSEAINTALSALGATLRKQDVTANNIANANTHDFKKSRAFHRSLCLCPALERPRMG